MGVFFVVVIVGGGGLFFLFVCLRKESDLGTVGTLSLAQILGIHLDGHSECQRTRLPDPGCGAGELGRKINSLALGLLLVW